jgi:hypothetical protein
MLDIIYLNSVKERFLLIWVGESDFLEQVKQLKLHFVVGSKYIHNGGGI